MFDNNFGKIVDRFSKFFHQVIHKKIVYTLQRFPPRLQLAITLPCESRKSKKMLLILTAPQQTVDVFLETF